MNRVPAFSWVSLACLATALSAPPRLWYDEPASKWVEALPVGNGHMGGMVFGGITEERIQFNEDTFWSGRPMDRQSPVAAENLAEIRQLLFDGKRKEAEKLAMDTFMSRPLRQETYQTCGDLLLTFDILEAEIQGYRRELDLDAAVASVSFKHEGVTYRREVFASYPDKVIVIRLTSDQPGRLSFKTAFSTPHATHEVDVLEGGRLSLKVNATPHKRTKVECKLRAEAQVQVQLEGGALSSLEGSLVVENANSATLLLAAATSYVNWKDISADPARRCRSALSGAEDKGYDKLLSVHQEDHRGLFRRVTLALRAGDASDLTTDERIRKQGSAPDPSLAALYFQFGRYLLIASSRPGSQPANLQGNWAGDLFPPWDSKWTININTEMNYWPAEVLGLSECHEPLFALLEDLAVAGRRTAEMHYGARGWVTHHNTDIWRGTEPINNSNHGIWPTGGAWLATHLWEHYRFTGDKEFLAKRAYPILKACALFFLDTLVEDPRDSRLISGPSNSPEQGGLVMGPTMDHQIIRAVFSHVIDASEILGFDESLRATLVSTRSRIAPNRIGKFGQLQEWLEDKDDPNNKHRHLSHLWGVYPGYEIAVRATPKLAKAAAVSLGHRGMGNVGWSLAWQVPLWARLQDGEKAHAALTRLIAENANPNLFDQCFSGRDLPFEIDANFGGPAGVAEMLIQSQHGELHLLPALPAAWSQGEVTGLRARGGFRVDMSWKEGKPTRVTVRSDLGGLCRVRAGVPLKLAQGESDTRLHTTERGVMSFDTERGGMYSLQ